MKHCVTCTCDEQLAPVEPPVGTVVRDRFGGLSRRHDNGRWAPEGCVPCAIWGPMWNARGPLEVIGTYPEVRAWK